MSEVVSRTCTEIPHEDAEQGGESVSRPLAEFRGRPAYVLLGDPGAGKTTAFRAECEALGELACYIPARDFLALGGFGETIGETLLAEDCVVSRAPHP